MAGQDLLDLNSPSPFMHLGVTASHKSDGRVRITIINRCGYTNKPSSHGEI